MVSERPIIGIAGVVLSTRTCEVGVGNICDVQGLTGELELFCSCCVTPETPLEKVSVVSVLGR
jgi:hypothetical protein